MALLYFPFDSLPQKIVNNIVIISFFTLGVIFMLNIKTICVKKRIT